jgi:hypothetical protein
MKIPRKHVETMKEGHLKPKAKSRKAAKFGDVFPKRPAKGKAK